MSAKRAKAKDIEAPKGEESVTNEEVKNSPNKYEYALLFLFSTFIRFVTGTHPHSGHDNANPTNGGAPFGDFECHRTWMTVT